MNDAMGRLGTVSVAGRDRLSLSGTMRLFALTARALRFYEERGLVRVDRDLQNRRVYDAVARHRLSWIAPLRASGLPLAQIEELLEILEGGGDVAALAIRQLEARRVQLLADVGALDTAIEHLTRCASRSAEIRPLPIVKDRCSASFPRTHSRRG